MLDKLMTRFPSEYLSKRMLLQVDFVARLFGSGKGGFHLENIDSLFPMVQLGLQLGGLWERGKRNVLAHRVVRDDIRLPNLPPAFAGLRVLHLSDLHIDIDAQFDIDLSRHLVQVIRPLEFDLCLITGDFRYATYGAYDRVHTEFAKLAPALECKHGIYGVLGNHDFVEQVPYLEHSGVRLLVNEAAVIKRAGQELWLAGLDDPHFYGTHSFEAALADVPEGACTVLLVHSPEVAKEAERRGVALYLSGHTHAGQLCLPGGIAPYVNASCPRARILGRWNLRRMQGFTSAGAGSCGLPVRLNCKPEIAIHRLLSGGG